MAATLDLNAALLRLMNRADEAAALEARAASIRAQSRNLLKGRGRSGR